MKIPLFLALLVSFFIIFPTYAQNFPKSALPQKSEDRYSNWGVAGPQEVVCDGRVYWFGSCGDSKGLHSGVMCPAEIAKSSCSNCANENSSATINCYKRLSGIKKAGSTAGPGIKVVPKGGTQ